MDSTVTAGNTYSYYVLANSACGSSTTVNCNTLTIPTGYNRVPYSQTPTTIIKNNTTATNVAVNFDTTNCPSNKYNIIYGWGEKSRCMDRDRQRGVQHIAQPERHELERHARRIGAFFPVVPRGRQQWCQHGRLVGLTYPGGAQEGGASPSNQCSCTIKNTSPHAGRHEKGNTIKGKYWLFFALFFVALIIGSLAPMATLWGL